MATVTAHLVRRRTRIEQSVLRIMRGDESAAAGLQDAALLLGEFATLRDIIGASDLRIEPTDARIVSHDERLLLAWLASYQRLAWPKTLPLPTDPTLRAALKSCAALLDAERLKLPPLSLAPT